MKALAVRVAGAVLQLVFSLVVARRLGADGAGLFFLALSGATVAAVLGRVGLDNAVVRYVAANVASHEWGVVRGVYRAAMSIALPAGAVTSVALWLGAPWIATAIFRKPHVAYPLRVMAVGVVPLTLVALHGEALRGLRWIIGSQVVQVVALPGLALAVLWISRAHAVAAVSWAYVGGAAVAAGVGLAVWGRAAHELPRPQATFSRRELLHTSLPLYGMAAMEFVLLWTGTVSLGIWASSSDVGVFGIASRVAGTTSYVLIAANVGLAPKFAALWAKGERARLQALARHATAMTAVVAAPLALLLLAWPGPVLRLFGSEFVGGAVAVQIMVVGQYVNVVTGSVGYLLVMSGYERAMRNVVTVSMLSNVVLNVTLVPVLGLLGAAIASGGSAIVQNIFATFLVHRKLGILVLPTRQRGD